MKDLERDGFYKKTKLRKQQEDDWQQDIKEAYANNNAPQGVAESQEETEGPEAEF